MDVEVSMVEWRTVQEFPAYEVSSDGRLRRVDDLTVLRTPPDQVGRARFTFSIHCVKTYRYVHRLVAIAFHGEPPQGKNFVCHIDGNPLNNRADNLYWGDAKSNRLDAVRHGTASRGGSRFNQETRVKIREAARVLSATEIAREFGCDPAYGRYVRARLRAEVA